jgi:predicted TIM-barrel fold metal-dependent hydrolase
MPDGLVDVHTHYLPQTLVAALARRDDLPRISGPVDARVIEYGEGNVHPVLPAMSDLELRCADMDRDGIATAVLAVNVPGLDWFPPTEGPEVARAVNDELADVVGGGEGRLAALAALPMQVPEAAAAELERAVDLGFRGATIYSNVAGRGLHEPQFRDLFATAARLDVPLLVHPTYPLSARLLDAYALIPTLGFLVDTTTAALRLVLDGLYDRHPDLKLVLAHAGSLLPQLAGRIDYEAARDPNGYGALSGAPGEHLRLLYTDCVCVWPPALRSAVELLGPDRVMFGSDYPFWEPARSVTTLDEAGFDDDVTERLRHATARRLFALDPPAAG